MELVDEKNACSPHLAAVTVLEDRSRDAAESKFDFALLEPASGLPAQHVLRSLAEEAAQGKHPVCGRSRNSLCYAINGAACGLRETAAVLKKAVISPERTNPDYTFSREAAHLQQLARLGIADCPALLARFRYCGRHYLLVTYVPGVHPHPQHVPLCPEALRELFEKFFLMDQAGFIHYDLQAPNIVISPKGPGLIDFEFAGTINPFAVKDTAYLCDYNISPNPYVPLRSCVCNFEFRTLYSYLVSLRAQASVREVLAWAYTYLACKSSYHQNMAEYFFSVGAACAPGTVHLFDGGLPVKALQRGAGYETALAGLYRRPTPEILATEYLILKLRFELFERDFNGRGYDLRSGFEHAKNKVRAFFRRASSNPNGPARWYFRNCLELLKKLERKAKATGSAHSIPGGPTRPGDRQSEIAALLR